MTPILLHLGPLTFKTYGLFVALGALAALRILKRQFLLRNIPESYAETTIFLGLISGILGSRIFYGLTENLALTEMWRIWDGGLSFTGGLLSAAITLILYVGKKKIPLAPFGDSCALAIPIGHAIGRIGCFAAGCCWGTPSNLPWAVRFKNPESFIPSELLGVSLHPAQLYESLGLFLIFTVIWTSKGRLEGKLFGLYLILYSMLRFGLEFLRGDTLRYPGLGEFSLVQAALLATALPFGILWILTGRLKR